MEVAGLSMLEPCESCQSSHFSAATALTWRSAFTVGRSRQSHVLVGLIGGLVVGAATGAIIGNSNAKHCHSETCQVSAALGGGFDVLVGGVTGAVVGAAVGAVWPVRK